MFEYSLSLSELRAQYDSIDFDKEVQLNKTIESGSEGLDRYASVGIVYIVPRSGLYAVLSPLCAAIAAGSCAIVEVSVLPKWLPDPLEDSAADSRERSHRPQRRQALFCAAFFPTL